MERGRHAITYYKTLRDYAFGCLLECRLETGAPIKPRIWRIWDMG